MVSNWEAKGNPDPKILLAPTAERLFPKSMLGISIWAFLLVNKYEYQHPHNRTLEQLSNHGLDLSLGTITDGMKKLLPLVTPVYNAIEDKSIAAEHWHADETGWKVFEKRDEKENNRWFLWIFHNKETVVFKRLCLLFLKRLSYGELTHIRGCLPIYRSVPPMAASHLIQVISKNSYPG